MNSPCLLDANVLIALSFTDHTHHEQATAWFETLDVPFATCPSTQGALVRFSLRQFPGDSARVQSLLSAITAMPTHEFWPDTLSYLDVNMKSVIGFRQVTDAYLVELANSRKGTLATFDRALATVFPSAFLIPV